jgi:pectate lyase
MIRRQMWLVLAIGICAAWQAGAETLTAAPEESFTLAVIPDTQRYLGPGSGREEDRGAVANPAFDTRTHWLAENLAPQRVVFVSHMGDIVDRNEDPQWRVARENMDRLHGQVPYGISVGNHDMIRSTGDASLFQAYFGSERFDGEAWYGGTYDGEDPELYGNNVNSYQLFSAGGLDFIILHLECNAPDNVLAWADGILERHRDRMAIITTHMYLGGIDERGADVPQGRMRWKKVHGDRGNTPQQLWDKSFSKHPNLFLVLCGDQSASISHRQTTVGAEGNRVHEILTDYPRNADDSDWLRLLRFHPDKEMIEVLTYSPVQDRLCEGIGHVVERGDHQFELDISDAMADHRAQRATAGEIPAAADARRLEAVVTFADNVLAKGRDVYGEAHTPLFVDGIHVDTGEPVRWRYKDKAWIVSNMASQQNLFRTLAGLSRLLEDERYENAAREAIAHMFAHQRGETGLLYWGGHQFVDLETNTNVGEFDANCHEFKHHYPFYELMWSVDEEKTAEFIRAFWNAHILDWQRLDMNRHGQYGRSMGQLWDNEFDAPEPFFEGNGLTFINAGSDLIYAGGMLYLLAEEEGALTWSLRLAEQYVRARHPETKLGVYQYSQPRRRADPPTDESDPKFTYSTYGDRAKRQFGPEYGDIALEGNLLRSPDSIYAKNALMQLRLAENLGERGAALLEWTREGMRAYAEHAYDAETNTVKPMWADGTDLTGHTYPRYGYYGSKGTEFKPVEASTNMMFSYATGYRLTGDSVLWETARGIARGHDLGDLGGKPGEDVAVNLETDNADPVAVFALVELYRRTDTADYLDLARRIGDNIVAAKFHNGFFLPTERHVHARFDAIEPLALLALEAAIRGTAESVPAYNGGSGYIHGQFAGMGRTRDGNAIWSVTR